LEQAAALGVGVTTWVHPERDPAVAPSYFPGMTAITLSSDAPDITAEVAVSGAIRAYGADGATLTAAVLPLPATIWIDGATLGAGSVDVTSSCGDASTVSFEVRRDPGLAGRSLDAFPWFQTVLSFERDQPVEVALDPSRVPERAGATAALYVVDHKDAAGWAASAALVDITGGAEEVTVGAALADNRWIAWADPDDDAATGRPLDVVLDFDRDGALSPGDHIDGLDGAGLYVIGDLTEPGPHVPVTTTYSGGQWLGQRTYYPEDIGKMGAAPLVVISHGNGHQYTWYDYLGEHLTSWGYVVMAHQNNTGPGIESASATTLSNTDYFFETLPDIDGGALDGHVDGHRIVWIGHSRGGEGVTRAYDRLRDGESRDYFVWEDIVAIASIAPTVFLDVDDANPHDAPYYLIFGAADGDVNGGPDCDQCMSFRLSQHAQGPVQTTYLQGVGHNEFNCCGFNDATGPNLIGRTDTQVLAKAYFLALVEHYASGNPGTLDYFTRSYHDFRPSTVTSDMVASTTWRDALDLRPVVLDDHEAEYDPETASLGGGISWTGAEPLVEDHMADQDTRLNWTGSDPMNGMTQATDFDPPARGVVLAWQEGENATYAVEVPAGWRDVSGLDVLSFRAAQVTRAPETDALDAPLTFVVSLIDGSGVVSSVDIGSYGWLTDPYERTGEGPGTGWANEFATFRLPFDAFTADGVPLDLTDVASVRLEVGADSGSPIGRIGLDDLVFTRMMPEIP
jgi:dienelactone hydrolase